MPSRRRDSTAIPEPESSGAAAPAKRPGIQAVADRAGVSIATVSRVMNNRPVQEVMAKKVREAIQQVGYLPDVSARALSSGRSRLLGVIISNLKNPFFPELLQAFEEHAVSLGYEVLVASTAYDLQRMTTCINRMLERKVDGVAVMTFGMEGPLLERFADHQVPLVFMDSAPSGGNSLAIQVDYDHGVREAVQHLAVLGHRRIGYVSGPPQQESVAKRRLAVEGALKAIGIPQPPEYTFSGDHSLHRGEQALHSFLALPVKPTAILCSNDLTAIGVMHGAQLAGLSIPGEMSLIGFDGVEIGAYMVPPLTSILMSGRVIAETAVDALVGQIEDRPAGLVLPIQTHLLIRRTTAIPHGALNDLVKAAE